LGQNPLISVGNIGILFDIMKYFKISERESLFLLKNIDQLGFNFDQNNIKTLATKFGLFFENGTEIALVNKFSIKEINKLLDFEIDNNKKFSQTRDKESILDNLVKKASSNTTEAQFFECVEILSRVINIDKNIEESISEVSEIIKDISDKKSLTSLYNIVKNLTQYGIDLSSVKLDYGLIRDWGYYSSLVFNLYANSYDIQNLFGGGGRYDNLGQSLGLDGDLPALGFAIDSEKLLSFSKILLPKIHTKKIVVLLDDAKNLKQALEICFLERNKGNISYVETKFNNQENLDNWGKENKIHEIITLNGEEIDRRKI
jgi:histidyl-tRNA synthetase